MKYELLELGYASHDFHSLASDMNEGSRELLLAFAWLFAKQKLIRKLLAKCADEPSIPAEEEVIKQVRDQCLNIAYQYKFFDVISLCFRSMVRVNRERDAAMMT